MMSRHLRGPLGAKFHYTLLHTHTTLPGIVPPCLALIDACFPAFPSLRRGGVK
jgi:hypothetical protein